MPVSCGVHLESDSLVKDTTTCTRSYKYNSPLPTNSFRTVAVRGNEPTYTDFLKPSDIWRAHLHYVVMSVAAVLEVTLKRHRQLIFGVESRF